MENFDLEHYLKYDLFEMALAYGMSSNEYFFQDPELFYSYKNAFEIKQELKSQERWEIGAYVKKVLESTPLWVYGIVDGNKMKLGEYPKPPTRDNFEKEEILDEEALKRERFKAFAYFNEVHKSNLKRQGK